jgi:hypothetical protein
MSSDMQNEVGNELDANDAQRLDGNAAAGLLREIFAMEMTTALGTCGGCGKSGTLGELMLYGGETGVVLRCPACDHLLICITHTPEGYWLDLSGLKILRIVQTN